MVWHHVGEARRKANVTQIVSVATHRQCLLPGIDDRVLYRTNGIAVVSIRSFCGLAARRLLWRQWLWSRVPNCRMFLSRRRKEFEARMDTVFNVPFA